MEHQKAATPSDRSTRGWQSDVSIARTVLWSKCVDWSDVSIARTVVWSKCVDWIQLLSINTATKTDAPRPMQFQVTHVQAYAVLKR
jgi:hypothetical protein